MSCTLQFCVFDGLDIRYNEILDKTSYFVFHKCNEIRFKMRYCNAVFLNS